MELIEAKSIVSKTKNGSWFGSDYNMNIYRGCCHGCIYCDSRSECYGIENFNVVRAKANASAIIDYELSRKQKKGVVATGAMSDPYNPFEENYQLTRKALTLLDRHGFGIAIDTKSSLITRDIDLLLRIKSHSPVIAKITVTSADDDTAKLIEPHVCGPSERFEALRTLSDNGLFCGVLLMPILPFINDTPENIRSVVEKAAESGAKFIYPAFGVTLRQNQRLYFYDRLNDKFPGISRKYTEAFGNEYSCSSPDADALWELFIRLCGKYGLLYMMEDIIQAYKKEYEQTSYSFFDLLGEP